MQIEKLTYFQKQLYLANKCYETGALAELEHHLKMACAEAIWHLSSAMDKNFSLSDIEEPIDMLYQVLDEAHQKAPNILDELLVPYKQESRKVFALARINLDNVIKSKFKRADFISSVGLFPMGNNEVLREDDGLLAV